MSIEVKTVNLEDLPRWRRLIDWVRDSYGGRLVRICHEGEPVAYLSGPEFAGLIAKLAETWRNREPPFTQEALDRWMSEVLIPMDLSDILNDVE